MPAWTPPRAGLLPEQSLGGGVVIRTERPLLAQVAELRKFEHDAEPQAEKAQEALELLVLQVEEQVLQQTVEVMYGEDAIPVRVHLKEGGRMGPGPGHSVTARPRPGAGPLPPCAVDSSPTRGQGCASAVAFPGDFLLWSPPCHGLLSPQNNGELCPQALSQCSEFREGPGVATLSSAPLAPASRYFQNRK